MVEYSSEWGMVEKLDWRWHHRTGIIQAIGLWLKQADYLIAERSWRKVHG
jgi:hypothetical protein